MKCDDKIREPWLGLVEIGMLLVLGLAVTAVLGGWV
jgi:hypothetical protein